MIVSVCLSVCLSASISLELHIRFSPNFCMLPVAVARSSSGGVAICYVFPVLHVSQGYSTSRLSERSARAAFGLAIKGAQ